MKTVILAGGRGTRLAPYTSVLPKPLMPVGEKAILEILIERLSDAGIKEITLSVGYLAHLIRAVVDNGPTTHTSIRFEYVTEEKPLGTAAPLRLVDGLDDTFLVMNGDILTELDFTDLMAFHRDRGHALTIAAHVRTTPLDYGVLELDDADEVRGFREKPEITSIVSMGIYVMEPEVLELIPDDRAFDFPDLVHALLAAGKSVGAYRFSGYWRDLGRHEDYVAANEEWAARTTDGFPATP
jgi:NDP-sugar pyrophosphorylase family protein